MEKKPKTNQRSIRMTDEVKNYIEKFKGNGFNEKFENLVLYFIKEEKEIKERVNNLERYEKDLNEKIKEKREILTALERIKNLVDMATTVKLPTNPNIVTQKHTCSSSPDDENELQKCETCVFLSDCDTVFMKSHDYGENCALYEEEIA